MDAIRFEFVIFCNLGAENKRGGEALRRPSLNLLLPRLLRQIIPLFKLQQPAVPHHPPQDTRRLALSDVQELRHILAVGKSRLLQIG